MDRYGRRKALIFSEIPLVFGWLLICFANSVGLIYAGRVLSGLGSGMIGAPARVYTSEVTQAHLRGMLTALASTGISLGILCQYTFGSFLSWRIIAGISTVVPIVATVLMYFMPETPNFLVARAKQEKAVRSLGKLRGSTYNVQGEVDQLQDFIFKNNAKR